MTIGQARLRIRPDHRVIEILGSLQMKPLLRKQDGEWQCIGERYVGLGRTPRSAWADLLQQVAREKAWWDYQREHPWTSQLETQESFYARLRKKLGS